MEFIELEQNNLIEVDGGLVAGAIVGGILGGAAGLLVACGTIVATGNASPTVIWKHYVAGALTGAAAGAYTPF